MYSIYIYYTHFTTRLIRADELPVLLLLHWLIMESDRQVVHLGQFRIVSMPLVHPAPEGSGMDDTASDILVI